MGIKMIRRFRLKLSAVYSILLFSLVFITFSTSNAGPAQQDPYLAFAEQMPEIVGGLAGLYKSISYPDIAKRTGVEGKVYVLAMINEQGQVDDVKIIKGIGAGCDEAAAEAVKKAKFTPGKNQGVSVKVKMSLPIVFKLKY